MASWVIERIQRRHRREGFTCGEATLDEYLQCYARQNDWADLGRTYVAVMPGDESVHRSRSCPVPFVPRPVRAPSRSCPVPFVTCAEQVEALLGRAAEVS